MGRSQLVSAAASYTSLYPVANARVLIEACLESVESALAAEAGAAGRVELCDNLLVGGTTPSAGTVAECKARLRIPVDALIGLGVDRVLTSGQAATVPQGLSMVARLVRQAAGRIVVMPGCGIDETNVAQVVAETGATEVHVRGTALVGSGMAYRNPRVAFRSSPPPDDLTLEVTSADHVAAIELALAGPGRG